jgi:cobalt-zinc-cadmium resistance protein CzcA
VDTVTNPHPADKRTLIDRIIDDSLKYRFAVLFMGLVMSLLGLMSYRQLPVDAFPDVSPNLVQIFTTTDGLAPEEIEKYVTYPVESSMNGLPKIEKVRSVSNFGLSVVNVYFEDDMNIYLARQLVNERLQEAREQIPDGFGEPFMGPISTGMGLILFYYLEDTTGTRSLTEMRSIQDWLIKFHLQTVPGVTEVLGIGGWEKQFHVVVDPNALLRYNLTLAEVTDIIEANNLNVGAQFLEKNDEEYIVRSVGLATNIADLNDIVVKAGDGTPVFLRDIAEVKIGGAIRRGVQTRNGNSEVVAGMVIKLFGANSSSVIKSVEEKLEKINGILPKGVRMVPYYDQKTLVESCVSTVMNAMLQGIVLVAIVLLIFMGGFRPTVVVALSIPFSVLVAFFAMGYFGISANLMSLGGLTIAIGMMVDGTIVVVENVDRLLASPKEGESRAACIGRACREVGRPILFAISIIVVVFLPLFTLQGVEGKTFRPLAYTVALAMAGSLLFALTLAPVLSSFLMRARPKGEDEIWLIRWLTSLYEPMVRFVVKRRWIAVAFGAALVALGALVLPWLGSEFTPRLQEGTIVCRLTMAPSIALTTSTRMAMTVERRLLRVPEVKEVVSRIGRGEVGAHTDPVNSAEMYVILKPKSEWRTAGTQAEIEDILRKEIGQIPGVLASFTQPIAMTVDELLEGVRAELAIKLFGDDLDVLKEKADAIAAAVQTVQGAADLQVDQVSGAPQLRIVVNRGALARYGINMEEVQSVIRTAVGGSSAGQIFEGIKRFDIYVRFPKVARNSPETISRILISSSTGAKIPLGDLADIDEIVGPRQITRINNQRFIVIQCNVTDRDIGSFVKEAQAVIKEKVELPSGYLVTWGGQFRLQQEANKRLAVVVPVTLVIIFALLFLSFGSLKNSLLILLNIPLALVGGIVGLYLTGQNLSVPSSVGFIALFGIALENGMVLVTYMNQLVEEGMDIAEASVRGACLRMRPVLMTAITTGLGLFPLLLSTGTGSEVQRPLATVVMGGLVTSTVLTLLVVPALYKWFSEAPQENQEDEIPQE